jgi:Ca-activated chloride channel family protein
MIRLASIFWLIPALLVLARMAMLLRDRRDLQGAFTFPSLTLFRREGSIRTALSFLPFLLEIIGTLLLIVALARPQRVLRSAANDRFGIDIVIALDASGSMAAEDFRPRNRFAVAKEIISDFIDRRQDDRIGIVTFGVRAATRVPVTYDHDAAQAILSRAQVGENGDGTAIGQAIATAINRLKTSQTRSRIIILVTDGVSNSGSIEPITAAALAARLGIKVYTIGVGSRGEVMIPTKVQNPFTGAIETVYRTFRADLDEETLNAIARMTGAEYFRATDPKSFNAVLARIDSLEKSRLAAPKREHIDELYPLPLRLAMVLLMLGWLAGETVLMKVAA